MGCVNPHHNATVLSAAQTTAARLPAMTAATTHPSSSNDVGRYLAESSIGLSTTVMSTGKIAPNKNSRYGRATYRCSMFGELLVCRP